MAKKIEKTKRVVIDNKGTLNELGGISGPIIHPCSLPISQLKKLVSNRRKVYEVNPRNKTERVLLTITNVDKDNFPIVTQNPKANVSPTDTKNATSKNSKNNKDISSEKTESKTGTQSDFTSNS